MNSKKNLVEKPKTAKPKVVAKPKATKKNLVEKPKPVSKPNAVAKPKTTKKVSVEKLNKKRIWKGGNADADADEIIRILKDIKTEYFQFLINNIKKVNIKVPSEVFKNFVFQFFNNPIYSSIGYDLVITNQLTYLVDNLDKFGIIKNHDNEDKIIKLFGLFNIIRAIYNMNHALNIKDFVNKMDNYKDDKMFYNELMFGVNHIWLKEDNNLISRANSSTDNQQLSNSISSKASSSSIDPSSYAYSSNDSSSIASSFLRDGTLSSSYRPYSRLSTNSSFTPNVNSGRSTLSSMSEDSLNQIYQNKSK